jgi:hypothetical protein
MAINKEKLIKEFQKGTTDEQIETYHFLGEWIYEQIEKKREEALQLQEKFNGNKNQPLS